MRGLLFLARLITGVLPGMVAKPGSIFLAGDSQCTISVKYLRLANQMLYIIESHDVGNEVQKKMTTLAPEYEGSMWVTRGRLKKGLPKILGTEKLPVLLSSSRLAELMHNEDKDPGATDR